MWIQDRYECTTFLALVDDVENIARIAPKTIKPGDHKLIATS